MERFINTDTSNRNSIFDIYPCSICGHSVFHDIEVGEIETYYHFPGFKRTTVVRDSVDGFSLVSSSLEPIPVQGINRICSKCKNKLNNYILQLIADTEEEE